MGEQNQRQIIPASEYLKAAATRNIQPSFWMSDEYIYRAAWVEERGANSIWVSDGDIWEAVLPPIGKPIPSAINSVWSDTPGFVLPRYDKHFLDYEYLYDPRAFADMSGARWAVFRKNSRKWCRENPVYCYRDVQPDDDVEGLWLDWLAGIADKCETIHDADVMESYILGGIHRKILVCRRKIVGMNVWDTNYKFINFRYCINTPEPWLNEFMRLLFYTDADIVSQNKLVNDGGVLDRPSLKAFKDRLNPISVREVYSWKRL